MWVYQVLKSIKCGGVGSGMTPNESRGKRKIPKKREREGDWSRSGPNLSREKGEKVFSK